MSASTAMHVTIRLPLSVLYDNMAVRLTAVSSIGSFGLLPNHVNFVSDLQPSILSLWSESGEEQLFGIDEGLLVKKDDDVQIVVRRGLQGSSLVALQESIQEHFLAIDEEERRTRAALSRLEANMARRFTQLHREQP